MSARTDIRTGESNRSRWITLAQARAPWLFAVLVVASAIALLGLLYLNSYKNFYYDEWDFISAYRPGVSGASIFFPHGEHWSTIPILIWKALFATVGIRSHLPYQAIVVGAHVACSLVLYALVRRRSGDLPAFAAALVFLFLGTGANNIVQAFQGNQTLSVAFGLLAMLAIADGPLRSTRWRIVAASTLLLCSLMSSGLGLGFVVAIGVQLLWDKRGRELLIAVGPPIAIYLGWFLIYGKSGSPCNGCPSALGDLHAVGPSYLSQVASFVVVGLAASIVGVFGFVFATLPVVAVQVSVAIFAGFLAWYYVTQRCIMSWELGLMVGLIAQFTLIGLARVHFGIEGAADPRYVYTGTVYLLPLAANAVKQLPWNLLFRPVWVGALGFIVISNASVLAEQSLAWYSLMQTENSELRVVEMFRGGPDMTLDQPLDAVVMPQLTAWRYYGAIDELGSPIPDSVPRSLDALPPGAVDQQLVALFGSAMRVSIESPAMAPTPCFTTDGSVGSTIYTQIPEGQSAVLTVATGARATFTLGAFAPPRSEPLVESQLSAGTPVRLQVPNTRLPIQWRLRVDTGPVGSMQICGVAAVQAHSGAGVLGAQAAGGVFDPGWSSVHDAAAFGGLAAELPSGTVTRTWRDDIFGTPTDVKAGSYDVWYRVRVADPTRNSQEMVLGALDETTWTLIGATIYRPDQLGTTYQWVEASRAATQKPGHRLAFVTEFHSHTSPLSTDWFIDKAMLLPAGSPAPTDLKAYATAGANATS